MRRISVVVFDVLVEPPEVDREVAMRQVFAETEAVHLRARSPLIYQSGDYQRSDEHPYVWTGRLERIRSGRRNSVILDRSRGYQFVDAEGIIETSQATTFYAYNSMANVFVYRDTGDMPFTRISSYVRAAMRAQSWKEPATHCELVPRLTSRRIREWIELFTSIDRVRVQYSHSRSPGNRAVDRVLDALNAKIMSETIVAAPKEHLNKSELLNEENSIGRALDHIEKAGQNGEAKIDGYVDNHRLKLSTRNPVERLTLEVDETVTGFRSVLGRAAAALLPRTSTDE